MPHCIVEYSQVLESAVDEIMLALHKASMTSGLFSEKSIKVRAMPYKHALVAGVEAQFVHVTARIFAGRTLEQKAQLSRQILLGIEQIVLKDCSLTVEVIDIDEQSYAKVSC
tara:strand:- start:153 stop:488 length:336 start_codon:yes stop_codon:yes gene_type:complete